MVSEVRPRETLRLRGNKTHCFPRDQSSSVLLYLPTQNEKNCAQIVCFTTARLHVYRGVKEHDLITCESKELVSFDPGHVTRSSPIEKRI